MPKRTSKIENLKSTTITRQMAESESKKHNESENRLGMTKSSKKD